MASAQRRSPSSAARRPAQPRSAKSSGNGKSILDKLSDILHDMVEISRDENQKMDQTLLWIIIVLVAIGSLMMYSASYAYAYEVYNHDSLYFIKRQGVFAGIGILAMLGISYFPAHRLKDFTFIMLSLSYVLLVAVFAFPAVNDVHRWMLGFQPSEYTKFAIILFGASWADTNYRKMETFKFGILPYLLVAGSTAVLLFLEPHVSCMIIIILLTATMMFIGGVQKRWFAGFFAFGLAAFGAILAFKEQLKENHFMARIYGRLDVWFDPFNDPLNDGWQNIQALYAISSGGLTGQGIGNSRQKYLYISEPQNDFIFSVISEEIGFIGSVFIILLFMIFVWRGLTVSVSTTNRFCKYLGVGITAQVGWQALLNMMVVTGLAPNTGISLPFFSYGGSSLVMLLAEMGILLAISRHSAIKRA